MGYTVNTILTGRIDEARKPETINFFQALQIVGIGT
jgi:hypothetical protein